MVNISIKKKMDRKPNHRGTFYRYRFHFMYIYRIRTDSSLANLREALAVVFVGEDQGDRKGTEENLK
ncbi:MAG: hypothetical protein AB2L20_22805 [Mangrovibacterium sp.]